jgi:protein-disulfide isomerase
MPSGKKSKQARRAAQSAPPAVTSKGSGRRRQASPRVLIAAVGGAVAVVVIVVLAVVLTGGGSGNSGLPKTIQTVGSLATGLPGSTDVNTLLKGIPQKGTTLGSAFAPVTMVEYIDLQCPICQEFETTVMPDIIPKYVRTGKVRVEMRPWAFIGPDSVRGQAAVLAAAKQNLAFNYAQVLYNNQGTENTGWLTDSMVYQIAASVPGLNVPDLLAYRKSSTVKKEAATVADEAASDKVSGTPSVFVGKSDAKPAYVPLKNGGDEATLVLALDTALAG